MMESTINFSQFASNLKTLAESNKISMTELGKRTGITPAALSRYLNNKREPELSYVVKLAQYFGVTTDWLLGLAKDGEQDDAIVITKAYRLATNDDKRVVQAVLNKYIKDE